MSNCNRIKKEGNCDASEWLECTYCGAIDREPCRGIKKHVPTVSESHQEVLPKALEEIHDRSLAPYEIQAVLAYILDRLNGYR